MYVVFYLGKILLFIFALELGRESGGEESLLVFAITDHDGDLVC